MILKNKKIILAVTGGIAAYKSVYLLRLLKKCGAEVQVIGTENSKQLIGRSTWESLSGKHPLFDTWDVSDSSQITHIMLAQQVDLIVVAPATANIIAKASNGIADDLLSTVLLAATVPVIFAPGMNTAMFENSATKENIARLKKRENISFVECGEGELACNDVGQGRMAEPDEILHNIETILLSENPPKYRWLISTGNTREYIDPIRFLTNGASGKTGMSIARAASQIGEKVLLVAGNVDTPDHTHYEVKKIVSAEDMEKVVSQNIKNTDILIMASAVADYTCSKSPEKLKKKDDKLIVKFDRTEDILLKTKEMMDARKVRIGFAAETENIIENGRKKLISKGLDMVIANLVSSDFDPFGSDKNRVVLITQDNVRELDMISKDELADIIVARTLEIADKKRGKHDSDK